MARAALLLAVALLALSPALADAATPDPRTTTANALARFLNDTAGLTRADASAATRRRLMRLARRIEGHSVGRPAARSARSASSGRCARGWPSAAGTGRGEGMTEIGYYRMPDADTSSAKTPQINRKTGDFYLFGTDIARGLDIYHFTGAGKKPKSRGKWMNAQEARIALAGRPAPGTVGTTYICLLDD